MRRFTRKGKAVISGRHAKDVECVVIGASAGGLEALSLILPKGRPELSVALVAVVHIPPREKSWLAEALSRRTSMAVKEADDKEKVERGILYLAPPDYHLLIEKDHSFALSQDPPVVFSRPSIDVLFESAADAYGPRLTGVVLTGASSDGARGTATICAAGGSVLVQDPSSAEVPTMPLAALKACKEAHCMSLGEISSFIRRVGMGENTGGI